MIVGQNSNGHMNSTSKAASGNSKMKGLLMNKAKSTGSAN